MRLNTAFERVYCKSNQPGVQMSIIFIHFKPVFIEQRLGICTGKVLSRNCDNLKLTETLYQKGYRNT